MLGFNARSGVFSSSAVSLQGAAPGSAVSSPDGTKVVRLRGDKIEVITKVSQRLDHAEIGASASAEVGWSPDSKAFSVTYSDGGNVGTYHVKVVYAKEG